MSNNSAPRIALVLGGGGLKGFAHIGALRALAERGVRPQVYAGSSIGALVAAAAAGGMDLDQMADRAIALKRKDLFRINHMGMMLDRMQSRSIYMESPLRALCDHVVPEGSFSELSTTLLVTAVDLERGADVVWGARGLDHVSIRDAVYASCALPGFFPPGLVDGRTCIDGGVTDNLPVALASLGVDAVIAIDVGIGDLPEASGVAQQGFASVYMRAASIMMHTLQSRSLEHWSGPPMLLVRPEVSHVPWFGFQRTPELLTLGYDAMLHALDHLPDVLRAHGGIFPRRRVTLRVDQDRCVGCGQCVVAAPHLLAMDARGKAFATTPSLDWSPADGAFLDQCPVDALSAEDQVPVARPMATAGAA